MNTIQQNCIIPSAAFSVPTKFIKRYCQLPEYIPQVGDLVYGEISSLGFHKSIESVSARIHTIHDHTRAIFVFGNRYAPDHYEGLVPNETLEEVDMLARSGIIGKVEAVNELIANPTRVKLLGYICTNSGEVVNTRDFKLINPRHSELRQPRSKIILSIGAAMNSGKSYAASACCYALSSANKAVRAAKVTGTASLKDILLMQDCGAKHVVDFTSFGYPSTYMLSEEELLNIFKQIDAKYGNNPKNYLVIEFADGIFQRETSILLRNPEILERLHRIVFCASDAAGVAGGLNILKNSFNIVPHAISGLCSSSPLAIREITSFTDIPILKSMEKDYLSIYRLIR